MSWEGWASGAVDLDWGQQHHGSTRGRGSGLRQRAVLLIWA